MMGTGSTGHHVAKKNADQQHLEDGRTCLAQPETQQSAAASFFSLNVCIIIYLFNIYYTNKAAEKANNLTSQSIKMLRCRFSLFYVSGPTKVIVITALCKSCNRLTNLLLTKLAGTILGKLDSLSSYLYFTALVLCCQDLGSTFSQCRFRAW